MGKLRVYVNEYSDFSIMHVSVPTTESYQRNGVFEHLVDIVEEIGYDEISGESKKATFIGNAMDILKVKFRNPAQMKRFGALIREYYEA